MQLSLGHGYGMSMRVCPSLNRKLYAAVCMLLQTANNKCAVRPVWNELQVLAEPEPQFNRLLEYKTVKGCERSV